MKIKINKDKRFHSVEFNDKTRRISFKRSAHIAQLYSGYTTSIADEDKYTRCKASILKKNMKDLQLLITKVLDNCYPGLGAEENIVKRLEK